MQFRQIIKVSFNIFAIVKKQKLLNGIRCHRLFISIIILLLEFAMPQMGQAQNKYNKNVLFGIEEQIAEKHNLQDTKLQLHELRSDSWKEQNYSIVALCNKFLITIDDIRAADTLFFKNSAMLDSILLSKAPNDLLVFTHVQQAERLRKFANQFRSLSTRPKFKDTHPAIEYRNLTLQELDSLIDWHYQQSLQYAKTSKIKDLQDFLWLSPNPDDILFRPSFVDVIHQSRVSLYTMEYSFGQRDKFPYFEDILLNNKFDSLFNKRELKLIAFYREWALDSKTEYQQEYLSHVAKMKIVNSHYYVKENPRLWNYIDAMCSSNNNMIASLALFEKIDNLIQEGYRYHPYYGSFDTSKRTLFKTAFDLFYNNQNRIDSFGNLVKELKQKISVAKQSSLSIKVKNNHAPNRPETIEIFYKEIDNLELRIVCEPSLKTFYLGTTAEQKDRILSALPAIESANFSLPNFGDYQLHKLNYPGWKLSSGKFIIWYKGTRKNDSAIITGFMPFVVTNISVINDNKTIFVLDRATGKPLSNQKVKLFNKTKFNNDTLTAYTTVAPNGSVYNNKNKDYITIYSLDDSLTEQLNKNEYSTSDSDYEYSKDEYDSKLEYYVENAKLSLFTDRAIYKPGQTVHYKGIITIPKLYGNKSTVLSERFLKIPFYQKLLIRLNKYLKEEEYDFYIKDPFGKNQDTIRIQLNKFGSFPGSFTIPKAAATGQWGFDIDFDSESQNDGSFRVEEYKKPSFEINIEKPKAELYLGDSTGVTIKVRSFAGAKLSNVKIEYDYSLRFDGDLDKSIYVDTFGFTNTTGELLVPLPKLDSIDYAIYSSQRFNIDVLAIDGSGESHEERSSLTLAKKPINISLKLPENIDMVEKQTYSIGTSHPFSGYTNKKVKLVLYEVIKNEIQNEVSFDVDFKTSSLIQHQQLKAEEKNKIWEQWVEPKTSFELPLDIMKIGYYKLELKCFNTKDEEIGMQTKAFATYNSNNKKFVQEFTVKGQNYLRPKESFSWLFASNQIEKYAIYHIAYFATKGKKTVMKHEYVTQTELAGLSNFQFTLPKETKFECYVNKLFILDNDLHNEQANIRVLENSQTLDISVHSYRRVMVPGQKQEFSVRIQANNKKANAELLTTIYDASLDKLEEHKWQVPRDNNRKPYWYSRWDSEISYYESGTQNQNKLSVRNDTTEALWWLNPLDYAYDEFPSKKIKLPAVDEETMKRLSITGNITTVKGNALNEVVVVGYGSRQFSVAVQAASGLMGKVAGLQIEGNPGSGTRLVIRGVGSLSSTNQPLVIMDGVIIDPDKLKNLDASLFTEIIVLKEAEGSAIYGSRAANGAVVISTKGKVILPEPKPVEVVVRKNFNETAFFAPAIHASANGFYEFEFTMPESVTEWNWKLFAHTKKLLYGYKELNLQTQLPLMVQPNMPRFLYQGDKINLRTRISNLDSVAVNGNFSYKIEDAITGEDISKQFMSTTTGFFSVKAETNSTASLWLQVPTTQLNPIKIIVKANTQQFGDGEEHVIPILAKKELVTLGIPYRLKPGEKTNHQIKLKQGDEAYAIGLNIQPQPQASIINALPALANYPFNCAEQLSSKIIALSSAIHLFRADSSLRRGIAAIQIPENATALPDDINENTMPWLQLNNSSLKTKKQLLELFDTTRCHSKIESLFNELATLQKTNGSFTWFKDGAENFYISNHVLINLKHIFDLRVLPTNLQNNWTERLQKLIDYVDTKVVKDNIADNQNIFARSLWVNKFKLDNSVMQKYDSLMANQLKHISVENLLENALLIQSIKNLGIEKYQNKAATLLENMYQLGYSDEQYGLSWKSLANNSSMYYSAQETVGHLLSAFAENKKATEGIIQWILSSQTNSSWGSTKATTTILNTMQKVKTNINEKAQVQLQHQTQLLQADNSLASFNDMSTANSKNFSEARLINNSSNTASGQLSYYYFSDSFATENQHGISVLKTLKHFNKITKSFEVLTAQTPIKAGDEIEVTLKIATTNTLQFVYVDDKRAAAFEPKDNSSGYQYNSSLQYYRSVRDAGMQFFMDKIEAGEHYITYTLVAEHEGSFLNNRCALQCMYQSGVKAYSTLQNITVEK